MFAPEDKKYRIWQSFITSFLVIEFGLVPLVIAFRYEWLDFLRPLAIFFDLFFLIDILITLRTALNPEIKHRYKQCLIFQDYLKSYLVFDLLATIPHLITNEDRSVYFLKTARFARIKTLFELLFGILQYLQNKIMLNWSKKTVNNILSFIKLVFSLLFIIHIFTCIYVYIGLLLQDEDTEVWLSRYPQNQTTFYITGMYHVV